MIGILGAYGAVGIWATRYIRKNSDARLRIGGRNIENAPSELRTEWSDAEWTKVDVSSQESVEKFINGCEIILDCAKLTEAQTVMMDEIAEAKHTPVLHLGIAGFKRKESGVSILYGAGCIPGLSGLIPQYLAKKFDHIHSLEFYYGGLGAFSYTAANDFIDSLHNSNNRTMVYWKNGEILPFTPSSNDLSEDLKSVIPINKMFPFFDGEAEAVTRKLNIDEARFHMCLSGQRTIEIMNSARHQYKQNPDETIKKLCTASKLDTFGTKESTFYLCVMEGVKDNAPAKFKFIIHGLGPSPMTGVSAGAATLCLAQEKKSCGTILLGESDLAAPVIESLIANEPDFSCEIKDMLTTEIEGEI